MRQFREYLCIVCGKEKIRESRFEVEKATTHAETDRLLENGNGYVDHKTDGGKLIKGRKQIPWQNAIPGEEEKYTVDKNLIAGICDRCIDRQDVKEWMEKYGLQFEEIK